MALDGNVCGSAVYAVLQSYAHDIRGVIEGGGSLPTDYTEQMWRRVCSTIFDHIKDNLQVASTGADPQGGTVTSASTTVT